MGAASHAKPGTAEWLHFWGYEGDDRYAHCVWARIQQACQLGDKVFSGPDWHALSYTAQSRQIWLAVDFCNKSDRERMTIEAATETDRLRRFIP